MTSDLFETVDTEAMIANVAATNDAIQQHIVDRLTDLIDRVFDTACEMLEEGSTTDRSAVMKAVLPLLIRNSNQNEPDADAKATLEETRRLIAEITGALTPSGDDG